MISINFLLATVLVVSVAEAHDALPALLDAYATRPQGYPTGDEFAQPDTSVPFRWHFYHADAIEPFAAAQMKPIVVPYNRLEDAGVKVAQGAKAEFSFVEEHATAGKRALQVNFAKDAVESGQASVVVQGIEDRRYEVNAAEKLTTAGYFPHFRWLKFDAFNPHDEPIGIRVQGVPIELRPGRNLVAVKTADAGGEAVSSNGMHGEVSINVHRPAKDLTLFLDNVYVEQECPKTIHEQGRMFQFPGSDSEGAMLVWPGFTPVPAAQQYDAKAGYGWTAAATKRTHESATFRSHENGLMWGACRKPDAPFRVDLPNGKYGVWVFAYPGAGWSEQIVCPGGQTLKAGGEEHEIIPARSEAELHRIAYSGEAWDFRPGSCVWEELLRERSYPPAKIVFAEATDGHLLLEFPEETYLRALMIFPASAKADALRELGRFNLLLAESFDVTHPWVKGDSASAKRYIGFHEEAADPAVIPQKLAALRLTDADFQRGFRIFQRDLTAAVYPDTIPSPAEAAVAQLAAFTAPGERECLTFAMLPLRAVAGLKLSASALVSPQGARIAPEQIDVRVSRYHQKTMAGGHHNHTYNYQEHYLVRRPAVDLFPAAARRVYVDVAVLADTRAGLYKGEITIADRDGRTVQTLPIALEVLPIELQEPPVFFAGTWADPQLKKFGFNTLPTTYRDAVEQDYRAYTGSVHDFDGRRIGLAEYQGGLKNLLAVRDVVAPLIKQAHDGEAPRALFNASQRDTAETLGELQRALPNIEILGANIPVFGRGGWAHELNHIGGPMQTGDKIAAEMEALRTAGKPFWFLDALRYSKEQPARFTFGFWLWRSGATGRGTTLAAEGQVGRHGYFTLGSGNHGNIDRALLESPQTGGANHSRDLVLIREGIDDYRYIYTLDQAIERATASGRSDDAVAKAVAFRDALRDEIEMDLDKYYFVRHEGPPFYVCYAENWYPLDSNLWNGDKFTRTRRACAEHLLQLK